MASTEMEQALENLDRRLARIEQILPTLASKDDLERFATKDDLDRFATREDLERFATEQDLEQYATKKDLDALGSRFLALHEGLVDQIKLVAEGVTSVGEDVERVATTVARMSSDQMTALRTLMARLEQKGLL